MRHTASLPKRILLIKLRHHGDVLLATPVARTLKSRFPDCQIDMLVYQETLPMLQANPDIEHTWGLDKSLHGWARLRHQLQLIKKLASQQYDWVIHLSDQWFGAVLAHWLHPKIAIGFDYPKRRGTIWKRCFSDLAPLAESNTCHTVEQNLLALSVIGITPTDDEAHCRLCISQTNRQHIANILSSNGITSSYIVVHPASRWFFKCWEDDRFGHVLQQLAEKGWPIVLTAAPAPQEQALVESILNHTRSPRIISLAGQLSLPELATVIDGSKLFVGVDSVPMHMAAALGKDTVALFGPSKINEWRPWKTRYRLINAADYGPLIDPDAVNTATHERYLSNIPESAVLSACEELLANAPENT